MDTRTLYFIVILIVISISGISMLGANLLNHTQETNNTSEIERIDWGQRAREIALKDEGVKELIGGKPYSTPSGIIWNETYAEIFSSTGGKIYKISIDLNNETVLSINEEKNQTTLNWIEQISNSVTAI